MTSKVFVRTSEPFHTRKLEPLRPGFRSAQEIWEAALGILQLRVTKPTYRDWLGKTSGLSYQDDQFVVGAPNTFIAEYLAQNQRSLIEKILIDLTQPGIKVRFRAISEKDRLIPLWHQAHSTIAPGSPAPFPQETIQAESSPPHSSTQEAIDKFIAAKRAGGLQPRSIGNYCQVLYSFARQYPALPSRPEEIEAILSSKNSDGTRLGIYKVLSAFYKFAYQRFGIPDIMLSVQKPRVKSKEPDCLTPNQARMVLVAIETARERGLVYLYLGQGLRLSEALRLDIRDVGEDLLKITGKERDESMPLLPEAQDALLKLAGSRGYNEPVFIGQQGRLGRDMAEENIKRLFIRAGVNGVQQSPKIFRSTFASLMLTAGCDYYLVKRLLRHSRGWDVTDRHYIHLSNEELRETLERYSPLRLLNQHSDKLLVCPNPRLTADRPETQIPAEADPAELLPQLLDELVALGDMARRLSHALGGNGHRPEQLKEIVKCLKHQACK